MGGDIKQLLQQHGKNIIGGGGDDKRAHVWRRCSGACC
jgi:hypothetical protein